MKKRPAGRPTWRDRADKELTKYSSLRDWGNALVKAFQDEHDARTPAQRTAALRTRKRIEKRYALLMGTR